MLLELILISLLPLRIGTRWSPNGIDLSVEATGIAKGRKFYCVRRRIMQFWNAQKDLAGNNCVSTSFAVLFIKGYWYLLVSEIWRGEDWNAHQRPHLDLRRTGMGRAS